MRSSPRPPHPHADPSRVRPHGSHRRRVVSALFSDPDEATRAYDTAVELGYPNEEIRADAAEYVSRTPARVPGSDSGKAPAGIVLAVEPHSDEDAERLVERWHACGAPRVYRRL